jgi:hypothetical protein
VLGGGKDITDKAMKRFDRISKAIKGLTPKVTEAQDASSLSRIVIG